MLEERLTAGGNQPSAEPVTELRPRRLAVDVHAFLRDKIIQGEYPPRMILSQAAIARNLGTSRGPVREAFRRLEEQGLVVAEPDHRTRVAGFDAERLDSLYGARISMETLGAGLTSATRSEQTLVRLRELLAALDSGIEDTGAAWREAHRQLHATIASGGGMVVMDLVISLAERSEPYYRLYGPDQAPVHTDHHDIVAAIE